MIPPFCCYLFPFELLEKEQAKPVTIAALAIVTLMTAFDFAIVGTLRSSYDDFSNSWVIGNDTYDQFVQRRIIMIVSGVINAILMLALLRAVIVGHSDFVLYFINIFGTIMSFVSCVTLIVICLNTAVEGKTQYLWWWVNCALHGIYYIFGQLAHSVFRKSTVDANITVTVCGPEGDGAYEGMCGANCMNQGQGRSRVEV